jgi:hypothetical protein
MIVSRTTVETLETVPAKHRKVDVTGTDANGFALGTATLMTRAERDDVDAAEETVRRQAARDEAKQRLAEDILMQSVVAAGGLTATEIETEVDKR